MQDRQWQLGIVAALTVALAIPERVEANPQGGTVVGVGATIDQTVSGTTTITQSTDRAIINWQSFNIGSGEITHFQQPATGSVALNRVTGGGGGSTIDGHLTAKGGVWLVNPSGVLFGSTARIDVHSLVATTADICKGDCNGAFNDFMNGTFDFSTPSADANAAIVNQGTITVGEAGLAALVAPHVRNEGMITGQRATVILAGAPTFALDFNGDGLLQFAATSPVMTAPAGAGALVENTGTISAPGGTVLLTAAAAANVIDNVINTTGVIEAQGISAYDGKIVLDGGSEGRVVVNGTVGASAKAGDAGAHAGSIHITGGNVALNVNALIDASSPAGGGEIAINAGATIAVNAALGHTEDILLDANSVVIRQPVETTGTVRLRAKHARTEGAGIVAAERLDLASAAGAHHAGGGGDATLITDINELAVGKVTASGTHFNLVSIDNQGNLSIGHIDSTGIEAGTVRLTTDGTLTLNAPIQASNAGDAIVLAAGQFVNATGSTALQAPDGRWLVYSNTPASDVPGGLIGTPVYSTSFPQVVTTSGNVFVYVQPAPPPPPPVLQPAALPVTVPPPADLRLVLDIATIPINVEPVIEVNTPLGATPLGVEPPQLIAVAPPSADRQEEDPLFASNGNRELWDLARGR